jgi:hypothetical protein
MFAVTVQSLSILLVATLLPGCAAGAYFEPSASFGTVGYPPSTASSYGTFPKNTIYFSPPNYDAIRVSVTAWCDQSGNPVSLKITATKLYWSDRYFKALPFERAQMEIAKDREEVVADSGYVEVDWSDGQKQIAPLSFWGQEGKLKFIISGQPYGPARLPLAADMRIELNKNNDNAFDVRIPHMAFSGHRLEFPVIHFRKVD